MTDKIILDIRHRDNYTDNLFLTAGLANRRIIPMIDPGQEEIRSRMDDSTKVIRCFDTRKQCGEGDEPIVYNEASGTIFVLSRYYLDESGAIDFNRAGHVRDLIEKVLDEILFSPENIMAVYHRHFPLLWRGRQEIFATPELFYARSARYSPRLQDYLPIGVILKAIEEDTAIFRLSLRGGCDCDGKPLLFDYPSRFDNGPYRSLYTWCPVCGKTREIHTRFFWREDACAASLEKTDMYYDKRRGVSTLSLLDVLDRL